MMKDAVIKIIEPSGYCSGVKRALEMVRKAKTEYPNQRINILGMIVHNQKVIEQFQNEGVRFIDNKITSNKELINSLDKNDIVILSAHGHEHSVEEYLKEKGITFYDATCPKVKQNLEIIKNQIQKDGHVIYIGKNGHPECQAALSISDKISFHDIDKLKNYYFTTNENVIVINQTTLNINSLKRIHEQIKSLLPQAQILDEICASTRLRQTAIQNIDPTTDLIIIVGDKRSSNSNKLVEIAQASHPQAYTVLINDFSELDIKQIQNKEKIAIASGTSTMPETIIDIYNKLIELP